MTILDSLTHDFRILVTVLDLLDRLTFTGGKVVTETTE